MAMELRVPALGESVTEMVVGVWFKREGDPVKADEPVVEVESDKATVALPAPAAGILRKILKASGANVIAGDVIAEVEERAAVASSGALAASAPPPGPAPVPPQAPESGSLPASSGASKEARSTVRAPPSVRRLMAEAGLDAAAVQGAVLRRADVERAIAARDVPAAPQNVEEPAPAPGEGARERVVPMTPLRRTVARRLVEAQRSAAILTTFNEIDMSRVMLLREQYGAAFQQRHGVKLSFMSFFVRAAVEALRAWPAVNAEIRGTDIVYKDHYDIGVAVGGGKGLVVPVLRDADTLGFAELERRLAELVHKARENRITMQDLEGGTFTISNGGVYGSLLSTPILNPPQSGILGLHKVEKRPVVDKDDAVVARPMMYVALSYDHRLVDGREAVSFLVRVKECIEDPERIVFEI
ncbi:MAG TPA: 2-oxoglutarate dehydrogenase complex dihydrolipoyllysine-residue succinyltransferase [Anaeromyxobacteraceae bacterium]|nr:2-oxoglutarate dehydrogenase complex dihydrolipoyllysine-residue succinyltransferase [Anaeromyxobacteraceae bacterium]